MEGRTHLARRYAEDFPVDAARRLDASAAEEAAVFLSELEPSLAAELLEAMLVPSAAAALERMEPSARAARIASLSVSRAVLLLRAIDRTRRAAMLEDVPVEHAAAIRRRLRAPEASAAVLSDPLRASVAPSTSAREAQRVARQLAARYVYVVDERQRLVGVAHQRDLEAADERLPVEELMSRQVVRLPASAPHWSLRHHPAWRDLDVLPVVDENDAPVGTLRHRSLRRLDAERRVGTSSTPFSLGAFLEFAELYWGLLAALFAPRAGRGESKGDRR